MIRVLSILSIIILAACQSSNEAMNTKNMPVNTSLPDWAKSANIYEVNIRQYSEEGTINVFAKDLPRLKEMGVDILWFMPIYPISTTKKKGTLGSYYSVSDFTKINPEFGTMEDVDAMIKQIHDLDMKVILDWVPNHTGWDHHWISDHSDWYTKNDKGEIIDPHNDQGESHGWKDVADLNYNSKEMRAEMLRQLEWWITEKDIDGYRMDIAFGVPLDFWHEVRDRLYSIKPIFMLAESEVAEHRNDSIFHATYGWNLFHAMNDIAKGEKTVQDFKNIHQENRDKFNEGNTLLFTSNHDENAWNGSAPERLGEGLKGWAAAMALLDGIPLIYSGMEEPMTKSLEFFEKDTIAFKAYKLSSFYKRLLDIKRSNSCLYNIPFGAAAEWISVNDERILAYTRKNSDSQISFFLNTSSEPIVIQSELLKGTDQFSNTELTDTSTELLPYSYQIIKNI